MSDDAKGRIHEPSAEDAFPATGRVTGAEVAGHRGLVGSAPCEERDPGPRPPRILIVEDEPGVRDVMVRALEWKGYGCETAVDGREGLDRVRESPHRWDLIFSNQLMPRMNGDAFLAAIHPLVAFRTPRILGSGFSADHLFPLGLSVAACDALLYPFDLAELYEVVDRALQIKAAYARLPAPLDPQDELRFLRVWSLVSGAGSKLYRTSKPLDLIESKTPRAARAVCAALAGLAALSPPFPSWVPPLLGSRSIPVRVQAARAIGRDPIRLTAALRVLTPALRHPDRYVADLAVSAIRHVLSAPYPHGSS